MTTVQSTISVHELCQLLKYKYVPGEEYTFNRRTVMAEGALNSADIYVVEHGMIKTMLTREKTIHFARPGQFVGLESLYPQDQTLRYESSALVPSRVIAIPKTLIRANPEDFPWLLRATCDHIARMARDSFFLATHSASARVAWFLLEESARQVQTGCTPNWLTLEYRRMEIATLLDVTNETISRAFGDLQAKNVIRLHGPRGRHIELLDKAYLKNLVHPTPVVAVTPDNQYALAA